jgi:glutaredoxin
MFFLKTIRHQKINWNASCRVAVRAMLCASVLAMTAPVNAQTIYRAVGADGKITFTDRLPVTADQATALDAKGKPMPAAGAALPFELRQVVNKYPVTLYTSSNCTPCAAGRALLSARGVPFAEKTVNTVDDTEALRRVSGGGSLPLLTIGAQQLKGFSDSEWTQFLNAAGYPASSMLPNGYRQEPVTALVAAQTVQTGTKAEELSAQQEPAPSAPPAQTPPNPAGIRF